MSVAIRNKSGGARYVPAIGREVDVDEVVEVPDDVAPSLVCQSIWEAVKAKKPAADGPAK